MSRTHAQSPNSPITTTPLQSLRSASRTDDVTMNLSRLARNHHATVVWDHPGPAIWLGWIASNRKGAGAEAMRKLTAAADQMHVLLRCVTDPDDRGFERLAAFYERFGFQRDPAGGDIMERAPKAIVPKRLYKWVIARDWQKYDADVLPAKRWKRYVEPLGKLVTGNSFTDEQHLRRWRLPEHDLLIILETAGLPNAIWPQNGSRAHLQTLAHTQKNCDPMAYLLESTEIDEFFVQGSIRPLSAHVTRSL